MRALGKNGFSSVLMHFRGCSGKENLLARSYHSGDSGDASEYITSLTNKHPKSKLFAIGYSLGANMLLKLLGEKKEASLLSAAVAVSPPLQLDICARQMDKGFSKFYQHMLLQDLKASLDKKYDKHDMNSIISLKRENIKKLKTFWDFDGAYTAPVHGFTSAQDYYSKSSSRQYLKNIKQPTLIIHSLDDPFMTPDILPSKNEISSSVMLEVSKKGGHVGFISGSLFKPKYWTEQRIIKFFRALL